MEETSTKQPVRDEVVNSCVSLDHCLFCNSRCTNNLIKNEWLSSSLSQSDNSQLNAGVFIVRILLEIPQTRLPDKQLMNLLDKSLTSSWLIICDQCSKAVGQAQVIYKEVLEATLRFRTIQQKIVEKVVTLSEIDKQDDNSEKDKCRKFAQEHNYNEFGYPLVVHDVKSLRKLKPADQMEFSDVFLVKPEPREQEMQFILPDDDNLKEDKETQVNELSFAPTVVMSSEQTGIKRKKEYRCVPCNKVFNNRQNLFVHNDKFHKADPRRTCEFCGRILANSATLIRHRTHNCSEYKKRQRLIKERLEKGISMEYKCGSCDKNLNFENNKYIQKNLDVKNNKKSEEGVKGKDFKKRKLRKSVRKRNIESCEDDDNSISLDLGLD